MNNLNITAPPTGTSLCRQNFSKAAEDALNQQVNVELIAAYNYQSIASWCSRDTVALKGFAKYYRKMAEEEREHAQKFIDYISMRGGVVVLKPISAPPTEWQSGVNILKAALEMERQVNDSLLNLHSVAAENGDVQLEDYIEGEFLEDQAKDIKKASDLITQLNRTGNEGLGLYLFDQQLERVSSS